MIVRERSLRNVVASWLGAQPGSRIRVTRFGHSHRNLWRYVCVESAREKGTMSLVFFRHDDGSWCIYPPAPRRPVMGAASWHEAQRAFNLSNGEVR